MKGILFLCIVLLGLCSANPIDSVQCSDDKGIYADENVDVEQFDYEPLHYGLDYDFTFKNLSYMDFDKMENRTYQASVMIDLKFVANSKYIVIATKNSAIQMISARDAHTLKDINVVGYCPLKGGRFIKITLGKVINKDEIITLAIQFSNRLSSETMTGIYLSKHRDSTVIATHFEPLDAVLAFPCFDFPKLKATFNMTIRHPTHSHALFNTELVNEYKVGNGNGYTYRVSEFANTPKMSTYLVALAVHNFKKLSTTYTSIDGQDKVINIVLPKDLIGNGEFALQLTKDCLMLYEKKFKIPYTLKKVDLIGIPNFEAGAMENWGLITFRTTLLVFDRNLDSEAVQQYVGETVAHELAHQWFGNLVTMKWWNDIWLNEGFATFMEFYSVNALYGNWRMTDFRVVNDVSSGKAHDSHKNTHPISYKYKTREGGSEDTYSMKELFDGISYKKSASLIYMLYDLLGDEKFFDSINGYIDANKFGASTSEGLWAHLGKFLQDSHVMKMMEDFTVQPGLPLLNASIHIDKSVKITQKRFYGSKMYQKDARNDKTVWTLPVTVQCLNRNKDENKETVVWLDSREKTFSFKNLNFASCYAIKLNKNGNGFFNVDYNGENWERLSRLLSEKAIPSPMDRYIIMSDAYSMLAIQRMPINLYMNLINYSYTIEDDYFVQREILISLLSIKQHFSIYAKIEKLDHNEKHFENSKKMLEDFSNVVKLAIAQFYSRFKPAKDDRISAMQEKMLKSACIEADCLTESNPENFMTKLVEKFTDSKIQDFSNFKLNDLGYMLLAVVKKDETSSLEKLYEYYKYETNPMKKRNALIYLTKSCRADFIRRLLKESFDRSIFSYQDYPTLIESIAANEGQCYKNHQQLAWEYLRKNYAKIKNAYIDSPGLIVDIISSVYSSFADVKFKDFETKKESSLTLEFERYDNKVLPMNERAKIIESVKNGADLTSFIISGMFAGRNV